VRIYPPPLSHFFVSGLGTDTRAHDSSLEGSAEVVSEQSQRKALYQKIMPLFPDGWMNTGYISREGVYTHPNPLAFPRPVLFAGADC